MYIATLKTTQIDAWRGRVHLSVPLATRVQPRNCQLSCRAYVKEGSGVKTQELLEQRGLINYRLFSLFYWVVPVLIPPLWKRFADIIGIFLGRHKDGCNTVKCRNHRDLCVW